MSMTSLDYLAPTEQAAITEYVARIRGRFRNRVLAVMLFGSKRVFGQSRWDETRQIRLPLYRAIVADGVPLTPERVPA